MLQNAEQWDWNIIAVFGEAHGSMKSLCGKWCHHSLMCEQGGPQLSLQ